MWVLPLPGHRDQAIDEIGALGRRRNRNRHPAQLVRWCRHLIKWRAAQPSLRDRLKWLVRHRRPHPIQPGPPIHAARRRECRAAELFRVQPMRHFLRRILPARQYPFHRLARKLIAESRLVAQRCRRGRRLRLSVRSHVSHACFRCVYRFPRRACSISMDSNSALKFPFPNPRLPLRWITSKNTVGRSSTGFEKICSR